ncbi:hypothetical protein [Clostridium sp.]|uniref:hypothetical protein n=1 Tax=Clostridium sp. TaxID=1506 RepID=UPI0029117D69|nr:hypothetical protein [Clostridium sp.]MDU6522290.1 hypothetical protein [Clostridium sp.]
MKIEMGESLMMTWVKHIKKCQIVQTNWMPSMESWDIKNEELIEELMRESDRYFKNRYGLELYKKNSSFTQLLQQAEVDVLGLSMVAKEQIEIYAIDIAFHEAGLNYGDKNETSTRVAKKVLRTAMCLLAFFPDDKGNIIFASPKINNNILELVNVYMEDIKSIFKKLNIKFEVKLVCNNDFLENILNPVDEISEKFTDTSELYVRSIQLYKLLNKEKRTRKIRKVETPSTNDNSRAISDEIKVGKFVRETLTYLLENNKVDKSEIEKLKDKVYSKQVFNINYPLLVDVKDKNKVDLDRYWKDIITSNNGKYYICSQWYEKDKSYFIDWLGKGCYLN